MSSKRVLLLFSLAIIPVSFIAYRSLVIPSRIRIDTENVVYEGLKGDSGVVTTFYGVPYALPPVGERRFRAPVPLDTEEEKRKNGGKKKVIKALQRPSFCIQGPVGADVQGGAGSEDCLHLNIYAPAKALPSSSKSTQESSNKLPVLVYIHGGAFMYGNPLGWPFEHWIEQFPDIVIVSVYYRLSIFGFLSAPDGSGLDYNAGILDQIEALRWIKKNIASFGGDPDQITIDGQSAGGASILLHLLASAGKERLFHQAIAQSVYRPAIALPSETGDHYNFVAGHAGCPVQQHNVTEGVECMRGKDVATLMRAAEAAQHRNSTWRYQPVVDGVLLKDTPTQLTIQDKISHLPMIAGSTTDETPASSEDLSKELRQWWPSLADADIRNIEKIYEATVFNNGKERVEVIVGEALNRCAREMLAHVQTKARKRAYAYRFDEPNPTTTNGPEDRKVQHSAENWWMFQGSNPGENGTYTLTPFFNQSQQSFAKELIGYWVSFVRSGDPNTFAIPGSPEWPTWGSTKFLRRRMVLREGMHEQDGSEGIYVSGSRNETVDIAEGSRCREMNHLAYRLHF
ncbi:alpha/beta-hydrolase [Serendipita vermifera]|nr:alpha/beta-hydrolase [Serendipita vermifera]